MADLQPYRFEPERVPKCEDSESENKVVNNPLQGTFGVLVSNVKLCQRKENVFVAENSQRNSKENKIEGRISSLYCISCSKWKNNFLSKLLMIKGFVKHFRINTRDIK